MVRFTEQNWNHFQFMLSKISLPSKLTCGYASFLAALPYTITEAHALKKFKFFQVTWFYTFEMMFPALGSKGLFYHNSIYCLKEFRWTPVPNCQTICLRHIFVMWCINPSVQSFPGNAAFSHIGRGTLNEKPKMDRVERESI